VGELSVGAPLWLPARRPRALAVEIHDPTATLTLLHARVTAAVAGVTGWEPERRRFRAHVTVARVRDGAERTRGRRHRERSSSSGQAPLPATPQLSFTPSLLVLYRSWLSPAGATYEAICKCALSPADG
jgi:2'-5' RNA ligase